MKNELEIIECLLKMSGLKCACGEALIVKKVYKTENENYLLINVVERKNPDAQVIYDKKRHTVIPPGSLAADGLRNVRYVSKKISDYEENLRKKPKKNYRN